MKKIIDENNRDEVSLLTYFETCIVDQWGRVDSQKMNDVDFKIAEKWNKNGFLVFKRLPAHYITENAGKAARPFSFTHFVRFNDKTWELAHRFRKERGARNEKHLNEILEKY